MVGSFYRQTYQHSEKLSVYVTICSVRESNHTQHRTQICVAKKESCDMSQKKNVISWNIYTSFWKLRTFLYYLVHNLYTHLWIIFCGKLFYYHTLSPVAENITSEYFSWCSGIGNIGCKCCCTSKHALQQFQGYISLNVYNNDVGNIINC